MSEFKERALLRTQALRDLLMEHERERDALLDQLAMTKGKAEQIEKTIKRLYQIILDINKEEQAQEIIRVKQRALQEKEEFEKAKVGLKTPKPKR